MPHEIPLGPACPGAGVALYPLTMATRREPVRSTPVSVSAATRATPASSADRTPGPRTRAARAHAAGVPAARIPAYRWRMMVALAIVVSSGFMLGMLMTALR